MSNDARTGEASMPRGAVIAAVDGSARDTAVIQWAVEEAISLAAPLHVIGAVDARTSLSPRGDMGVVSAVVIEQLEAGTQEIIDRACERAESQAGGRISVTHEVTVGSPAQAVLTAASNDAQRIVVGISRKSAAARTFLGTVSAPIVQHAPCPVVLVPAEYGAGDGRIVVGVDGSAHSQDAISFALARATRTGGEVTLVTTWWAEFEGGVVVTEPGSPEWDKVEARYRELAEQTAAAPRATYPGVPVRFDVCRGGAAATLTEVAEGAELLVVGSRGRGGFKGLLLGSVSQKVLQSAPCPVAVLHRS
ncbi:universal stress protein [Janibacter sp. GXQ6167]|uniref:universal stress protein n=1 Tax=Janibacter sp. GXQ6167 TaxID=3240791 RepID=UPI003525EA46